MDDLLQFCRTESQCKTLEAVIRCGTTNKAAKDLGISHRGVNKTMERLRKYKNIHHSPGFNIKGKSTLFDADGNVKIEWVKTERDKAKDDQILETIADVFSDYKGTVKVKKAPKTVDSDLLNFIPLGDPHIGLYAWSEECGEDFDCDIAEKNLTEAFMLLMDKIPATETLMILNLGDFFHSDSPSNRTERGGNHLDVDGRWFRVLMIGLELMNQCVDLALKKHKKVIVRNNAGNHDPQTAKVLSAAMMQTYRKNPRVEVYQPENDIMFYEFGRNMICSSHGHFFKSQKAPSIMATYEPEMWGRTQHRFFFYGHIHHKNVKEDGGVVTESFNTLAARDAWHHASGYLSQRQSEALVFHKDDGLIERHIHTLRRG